MSGAIRFVVIVGSTGLYFGLAILGWGGFAAFFAHPARTALAVATLAMAVAAYFAGGGISRGVREDRDNRWVLVVFGVLGLLDGIVPAYADRIGIHQAGELLGTHRVRSRELERPSRRFGVERGVDYRFHHVLSVQRSEPLAPAAEQHDLPGLRDERRRGRAGLIGRPIDVIAAEADQRYPSRAKRLFGLGFVAEVRVRGVEPGGQEAEEDNPLSA